MTTDALHRERFVSLHADESAIDTTHGGRQLAFDADDWRQYVDSPSELGLGGRRPTRRPTGVVLYAPEEAQKFEELEWDQGWWISAALSRTNPGDRLLIYRTKKDQGVVATFDVAAVSFKTDDDLGWAAYGRPTPLDTAIPRKKLLKDRELASVFKNLQGRRYLPQEGVVADRLEALFPAVPAALSADPIPEPRNPEWQWRPIDRRWGRETAACDAIAACAPAWRRLGYATRPGRGRSRLRSRYRTDLKGTDRHGHGVIAEVKHLVGLSTVDQLDRYLTEARSGGGQWAGHLIALAAYTREVAQAVEARGDLMLWVCERDGDGDPEPIQIA